MEGEMIPEVVLSSGWKMPVIGMGTAASSLPAPEILKSTLVEAIKAGYRHFDTASLYGSEEPLGQAVAEALKKGLIDKREDIFITSKLWVTDAHPDLVLSAIKTTLQKLDLEYVDLYLIHWPIRSKKEAGLLPSKENLLPLDIKGTWEAMEECCKLGLAKSIGVSNFSCKKLSQLLEHATIPPAVDQVELNPGWQQKKLIEFCKEKRIHVTAFSPLGANGAPWGSFAVMDSPVLKDIATTKGKSIAQISLRWIYEQGVSLIVKSFDKERMKENLQILDWKLSDEELAKIKQIPQCRGASGEMFVSPHGPYKSLEELWDGEF